MVSGDAESEDRWYRLVRRQRVEECELRVRHAQERVDHLREVIRLPEGDVRLRSNVVLLASALRSLRDAHEGLHDTVGTTLAGRDDGGPEVAVDT